jgi:hypothetical protein
LSDGVRDVDLLPSRPSPLVAAVLDNGSLELWNWRSKTLVCKAGLAKGGMWAFMCGVRVEQACTLTLSHSHTHALTRTHTYTHTIGSSAMMMQGPNHTAP